MPVRHRCQSRPPRAVRVVQTVIFTLGTMISNESLTVKGPPSQSVCLQFGRKHFRGVLCLRLQQRSSIAPRRYVCGNHIRMFERSNAIRIRIMINRMQSRTNGGRLRQRLTASVSATAVLKHHCRRRLAAAASSNARDYIIRERFGNVVTL